MNIPLPTIGSEFYSAVFPILVLCLASIISLLQGVSKGFRSPAALLFTLLVGLIAALVYQTGGYFLGGAYISDMLSIYGKSLMISASIVLVLFVYFSTLREKFFRGEVVTLFLMVLSGFLMLISSTDLISVFVGLELSSIGLYSLVGYINPNQRSQEGALKYFILGSISAAFLLYGMGLLYFTTGTLGIDQIFGQISQIYNGPNWLYFLSGLIMFGIGLTFKMALAPFHMWTPDAYEGAPTALTAFMATAAKTAIILLIFRVISFTPALTLETWQPFFSVLAIATIVIGNIFALVQTSIKRILAYSSIAHSGYLAIGLAAAATTSNTAFPYDAILFYLIAYTIMSIAVFGVLIWLEEDAGINLNLMDIHGLAKKHPFAALSIAVCMLSFAGIPPTVGFMSKFFLFKAALDAHLYSLVIVGILGSAVSLYYYLRIVVNMYMRDPTGQRETSPGGGSKITAFVVGILVVLIIALGTVLPGPLLNKMADYSKPLMINKG